MILDLLVSLMLLIESSYSEDASVREKEREREDKQEGDGSDGTRSGRSGRAG